MAAEILSKSWKTNEWVCRCWRAKAIYISTLSFTAKCNNDHDDEEEDNEYNNDEDEEDVRVVKKDWFEDRRSSLMRPR